MRRLHLAVGIIALSTFLSTGVYMKFYVINIDATQRLLFRSSHIYLLFAALLNLMLGRQDVAASSVWRGWLAWGGSVLVLMGPVLFVLAFCREPWLAGLKRPYSLVGVVSSFAGVICHLISSAGDRSSGGE